MLSKARDGADDGLDVVGGNQPRTFELARCVLVARAPEEVLVVKSVPWIVPAAIAGVVIHHAIRRGKFIQRMGETADHYHRRPRRPREP